MRIALAALFLTLAAPAAPTKPEIRDVQASHGLLGPQRATLDYLPGDEVFLRFTVAGAAVTDDGRLTGEVRMTLRDAAGQVVFQDVAVIDRPLPFGGGGSRPTPPWSWATSSRPGSTRSPSPTATG